MIEQQLGTYGNSEDWVRGLIKSLTGRRLGSWGVGGFCFFFQAEDGLGGLTVTGVQTCALPISPDRRAGRSAGLHRSAAHRNAVAPPRQSVVLPAASLCTGGRAAACAAKWPCDFCQPQQSGEDRKSVV